MTPEFTETQKAFMELLAEHTAEAVLAKANPYRLVENAIQQHVIACSYGQTLKKIKWGLIGLGTGLGVTQIPNVVTLARWLQAII